MLFCTGGVRFRRNIGLYCGPDKEENCFIPETRLGGILFFTMDQVKRNIALYRDRI